VTTITRIDRAFLDSLSVIARGGPREILHFVQDDVVVWAYAMLPSFRAATYDYSRAATSRF
jgi:hypothetical protein